MRYTKQVLFALLSACLTLFAQANPQEQLRAAYLLDQQGRFDEVIQIAKSIVDSNGLSGVELDRAYMVLGHAYQQKGSVPDAEHAYDQCLRILERDSSHMSDYAATLENYAGLYNDTGRFDLAKAMWLKAFHLRAQSHDHAAAARSLINLAGLAVSQHRIREARKYLNEAADEMKLAHDLIDDDFAVLFETQAWLALTEGNNSAGVAAYQRALEVSSHSRGEQHWIIGWEHMLLGKAYAQSGDLNQALTNMREGLAILEHALGPRSPKYFLAQIAYSQVLDRTGAHSEAAQLRTAAEEASKDLYPGQCAGCTINVAGFR